MIKKQMYYSSFHFCSVIQEITNIWQLMGGVANRINYLVLILYTLGVHTWNCSVWIFVLCWETWAYFAHQTVYTHRVKKMLRFLILFYCLLTVRVNMISSGFSIRIQWWRSYFIYRTLENNVPFLLGKYLVVEQKQYCETK